MAEIVGGEANKYVQCAASGKEWGTGHEEITPDNLMNRRYRKGKWYQKSSLHPSGRQPRRGGITLPLHEVIHIASGIVDQLRGGQIADLTGT